MVSVRTGGRLAIRPCRRIVEARSRVLAVVATPDDGECWLATTSDRMVPEIVQTFWGSDAARCTPAQHARSGAIGPDSRCYSFFPGAAWPVPSCETQSQMRRPRSGDRHVRLRGGRIRHGPQRHAQAVVRNVPSGTSSRTHALRRCSGRSDASVLDTEPTSRSCWMHDGLGVAGDGGRGDGVSRDNMPPRRIGRVTATWSVAVRDVARLPAVGAVAT
jgi:hypothetical protein